MADMSPADALKRLREIRRDNRVAGKEGKFSKDENMEAKKALLAEGVDSIVVNKAFKALTPKKL